MLGFGITKIVFTLAVIAMIWYGSVWWARIRERAKLQQQRRTAMEHERGGTRSGDYHHSAAVEDTMRCASCGAYVPSRNPRSCGRADCLYPG